MIETLQGRKRAADVSVLSIVVILYDPGVTVGGPFQQRHSPGEREGHAQRALMRRGDDGNPGARRQGEAFRNDKAFAVDGDGHGFNVQMAKQPAGRWKAWVLDPCLIARFQKSVADEFECVSVAGCDEHLRGRAADSARDLEVGGNLRPQCLNTTDWRMRHA